jgi:hypothetical protein
MSLSQIYDPSIGLNERGIIPAREQVGYALGVDLGRQADFTAISLVEKKISPVPLELDGAIDARTLRQRVYPPKFTVKLLERRPLGEDYVEQASRVAQMVSNAQKLGMETELVVDKTGVGVAVVDIFRRDFALRLTGITITAGTTESNDPDPRCSNDWRVPKQNLVSTLQAAFARDDLKVVPVLSDAPNLARELKDFQVRLTDQGNITTGARSGSHDDLVLSVAIALWKLARRGGGWSVQPFLI